MVQRYEILFEINYRTAEYDTEKVKRQPDRGYL